MTWHENHSDGECFVILAILRVEKCWAKYMLQVGLVATMCMYEVVLYDAGFTFLYHSQGGLWNTLILPFQM